MVFNYQPKLTEEMYEEHITAQKNLLKDRRLGLLSQSGYIVERNRLNENLFSKTDPKDISFFQDITGLGDFLSQLVSAKCAEELIKHELDHGEQAKKLGYCVEYGAYLMQSNDGGTSVVPFTFIKGAATAKHLDQIITAPENMSESDMRSF